MKKKASGNNRCRPYYRIIAITAGTKILERFSYSKEDGPECILWFGNGGGCGPRIK